MNTLAQLQAWYDEQCDGEWEHARGVTIESLDNPGWRVRIDLKGTPLENRSFDAISRLDLEREWISCEVKDGRFEGAGGPYMLEEILQRFLQWASEPAAAW
jgi:hypothetical protein